MNTTDNFPDVVFPDVVLSDEEYSRAGVAGEATQPRAKSVRYDRARGRLVIELFNGAALVIPTTLLQGLAGASAKQLEAVEILAGGYAVRWPALDVDFTVPGLMQGVFGTKQWMGELSMKLFTEAGRKGGQARTRAKRAAARANGKLGGRPRKTPVPT
jgi:hypothetical protein